MGIGRLIVILSYLVVHPYLSFYEKFSSSRGGAFERFLVSWWCASLVYCNFICLFSCLTL
jgi:hypothetical protein